VSKNEAVSCDFQTHFGSCYLARFMKNVLGALSPPLRQKRSCLPWSSDAFWKFFACKVYRKSSGRIFTIYVSKNEVVSCDVQTHFVSFHLSRFMKKVLGALSRILRPKTKLFALEFRSILEILRLQFCRKVFGRIFTIFASKSAAVCREVQTHFGSSPHSRFTKDSWAHFHDFCVEKRSCFS